MSTEVVDLARNLVSISSVSGNENEIAQYIFSHLKAQEVSREAVEGFPPNIVARKIAGKGLPTIVLNGHMDTVPASKGWKSDPLEARIEKGRLYGLGAADMKGGLAVLIDVFNNAKNEDYNLIFSAVVDEEGDSTGAFSLLNKIEGSLCIVGEPSGEKMIIGCRGRYAVFIELFGKPAHGSRPDEGVNAITEAGKVINALDRIEFFHHPQLGKGSICILKIIGGGDFLSVPEHCAITVDRHIVPGETREIVWKQFRELLSSLHLRSRYKLSWVTRKTPFLDPYLLDLENEFVKRFREAHLGFYGFPPVLEYGKAPGDYNAFSQKMPTVVYGPIGKNWHSCNEYVEIESLKKCRDFLLYFLESL